MRGQNFPQNHFFLLDDKALVFERIVASFCNQRSDIFFFQKKLVEPGELRQHLEVGEILRLKVFLCPLRGRSLITKAVEQFLITRIAADEVGGIGLKQILQGKTALRE